MSPLRGLIGSGGCEYTLFTCPVVGTTAINTLPSPTGPALMLPQCTEDGGMELGQTSSNAIKDAPKRGNLTPGLQAGSTNHSQPVPRGGAFLSQAQEAEIPRACEAQEIRILLPHIQSSLPACTFSEP